MPRSLFGQFNLQDVDKAAHFQSKGRALPLVKTMLSDHMYVHVGKSDFSISFKIPHLYICFLNETGMSKGTGKFSPNHVHPDFKMWRHMYKISEPLFTGVSELLHSLCDLCMA